MTKQEGVHPEPVCDAAPASGLRGGEAEPSAAWVLAAVRQAFEYGVTCGRRGSRIVVTDDGLVDGADYVEQVARDALSSHTQVMDRDTGGGGE